ncbi:MAG: heme biosynthesis protein HemY [Hyphomicrobiales bacterium]|nr:heme biosynthesis protein HemY [Hyphomicrobiales bacterium]
MTRLIVYLVIILAMGFGFSWIADNPGVVTLNWQGKDIRTSLMVTVVALVAIVAIILFVWGIFRGIIGLPFVISRFLTNRRHDRGYTALSKGLIAASTGDKALARRLTKESTKLLKNEPLVDLLDAQTALLEGNRDTARAKFQAMLENEETKLLGLRGLYLEAEREGAREASRQYADEASALSPSLAWAGHAKLRNLSMDGDWEGALQTLESNRAAGLIEKEPAIRQRAVLLTARAMVEEAANPALAIKLASEAHRLAPGLVAGAVIGASACIRNNKLRKASKMLEATWKLSPHPELADTYVHMRIGDSAGDRLKRAQTLAKIGSSNPVGGLAIAEASIEAKDWKSARDAMQSVIKENLTERACLVMADIEEGEHGDAGRMREWLSKAVRAPRDAVWTAEGYTSKVWLPVSPITGDIDVFEWKVPVEQLQASHETIDIGDLAEPLKVLPVEKVEEVKEIARQEHAEVIEPAINPEADQPEDVKSELGVEEDELVDVSPAGNEASIELEEVEKPDPENSTIETKPLEDQPTTTVFPLERRPDDPGIDPGEEAGEAVKGYKIH